MSVEVMTEVWALGIPPNEKLLLLDFANDAGISSASAARVAWKTGCSEHEVQVIRETLLTLDLLEKLPYHEAGRIDDAVYRVKVGRRLYEY